jgi:hypothetical protein
MEYLCHKWPWICSTCRKHFPVLSSFMTYHRVCNYINTTGAASGAGTAYPSGAPECTPGLEWDSCYSIFSFICMFCRSLFVLFYFFFWPMWVPPRYFVRVSNLCVLFCLFVPFLALYCLASFELRFLITCSVYIFKLF